MFKDLPIKSIIVFAIISSIIYLIFVGIFLTQRSYTAIWILYIGNGAFAISVGVFIYLFNKNRDHNAKAGKTSLAGHLVAISSILITCLLVFLASIIFPHWFHSYDNIPTSFRNAPPQMRGSGDSFLVPIFGDAVVGNIAAGSFMSILFPFALKWNQKGSTATRKPNAL